MEEVYIKTCPKCHIPKDIECFARTKIRKDGRQVYCRDCMKTVNLNYRLKNIEKEKQRAAKYYRNNAEKVKTRTAKWAKNNPDKISQANKKQRNKDVEKNRQRIQLWKERNPDKERDRQARYHKEHYLQNKEHGHLRRARMKKAQTGKVSFDFIIQRDNGHCYICDLLVDPQDLHFDHVFPLSKGGSHTEENIAVSHSSCNLKKSNKIISSLLEKHEQFIYSLI